MEYSFKPQVIKVLRPFTVYLEDMSPDVRRHEGLANGYEITDELWGGLTFYASYYDSVSQEAEVYAITFGEDDQDTEETLEDTLPLALWNIAYPESSNTELLVVWDSGHYFEMHLLREGTLTEAHNSYEQMIEILGNHYREC